MVPPKGNHRKTGRDSRVSRHPQGTGGTCKTCTPCRQKKVKCDGGRPQCIECTTNGLSCTYPPDARREPRPSRARVQSLEVTVAAMLEHMKSSGIFPPVLQPGEGTSSSESTANEAGSATAAQYHPPRGGGGLNHLASTAAIASPLPTPSGSTSTATRYELRPDFPSPPAQSHVGPLEEHSRESNEGTEADSQLDESDMVMTQSDQLQAKSADDFACYSVELQTQQVPEAEVASADANTPAAGDGSGMSPCEARVAGAFHEHGSVSSVHGLASIMNPASRAQHKDNISKMTWKGEPAVAASKARLISNAALQGQREARIFRQPRNLLDLDGCDPELAKHLLDLHFNRQHYAYLISYRPAIMDSLANGGGPWLNKLLLNAIYYSSTLYSDRQCFRSDPHDPQSIGSRFYSRFRQLLVDEIDKPSIPSATALLLVSATLVSHGRPSAGWNLSGTAYRMIIDMGCHLMLDPDYQSTSTSRHHHPLRRDLEQEMRKRLYWGAFVTDATQSLYLGRPCMFTSTEARVPLRFLDTFEELEEWEPYVDPSSSPEARPPAYAPQPAHAVSTFAALTRLFQIATRITDLYGIQAIKFSTEYLQEKKAAIEKDLDHWSKSLPAHMILDPDGPFIPPPHQITPHTTFHALIILLNRAFFEEGHLRRHSDEGCRRRGEEACINSALAIQKLVRAYRTAFTLRRAPFLLSYAIYSAVIVIVRQERHDRGQFMEPISFFWICLSELQRGCNFGLEKPLSILRDMVHEFQISIREGDASGQAMSQLASLDESFFFPLPMTQQQAVETTTKTPGSAGNFVSPDYLSALDQQDLNFASWSPGFLDSLNEELEMDISHDTLYGLFAPPQLFQ